MTDTTEPTPSTDARGDAPGDARSDAAVRRRLERSTLNAVLDDHPTVADVLARHGVDPRTRCHHAARAYMPLRVVLRRICPVDDVDATWRDLVACVREGRRA